MEKNGTGLELSWFPNGMIYDWVKTRMEYKFGCKVSIKGIA